jgi:hypothetical protein
MAYNFVNRLNFYARARRPLLLALLAMFLVVGYGLSLITQNQALAHLLEWITKGIVATALLAMLASIFHKT